MCIQSAAVTNSTQQWHQDFSKRILWKYIPENFQQKWQQFKVSKHLSEQGAFSHTSVDSVSPESCWKLPPCCILTTFLLNLSLSSGSTWDLCKQFTHTHTQPFYGDFSGTPGWAGARRELLDFMVQGEINRGRHTDHPAGRHSIRTNQCPPPPPPPCKQFSTNLTIVRNFPIKAIIPPQNWS